jgi:hypothetical protein
MSAISRSFLRLVASTMMALALTGCGRVENYRYKLTLAVDTPAGVKRGASVHQVSFWSVSIPERGIMQKLRGEALYLDLGPGARPLIVLLTNQLRPGRAKTQSEFEKVTRWTRDWGPGVKMLSELYGPQQSADGQSYSAAFMANVVRIGRIRGPHKLAATDLPDLVTFADIGDPKSVIEVDPNDLQATLGPDISWREITLEMTDEPITTGIRTKLPWIPAYYDSMLDGAHYQNKNTLANRLGTGEFDQSGDLKRRRDCIAFAGPLRFICPGA